MTEVAIENRRWLTAAVAATLVLSALFWNFPALDIAVSRLFYVDGQGFVGARSAALVLLLKLGRWIGWAVGALMIAVLVAKVTRPERVSPTVWRRWWLALLSVALGPGLLVNGLLKAFMGRARPVQTRMFGGTADFVPAWTYSTGCDSNCSFVSGEASFSLYLLVFAFWFAAGASRTAALATLGLFGLGVSINRIAFGAHFLSDVMLAWALTAVVILTADRWLVPRMPGVQSGGQNLRASETRL